MTPASQAYESPEVRRLRHRRDGARAEVRRVTALVKLQQDYLLDCEAALQEAELGLAAATASDDERRPCVVASCDRPEELGSSYCTLHGVKWGRGGESASDDERVR